MGLTKKTQAKLTVYVYIIEVLLKKVLLYLI